ncbi:MAG: DUF4287 domain-containing protein [Planctomycetes bacterium]|nr:DUF4287 domain-containing protein [Planctomycetota bacterium]MBI3846250.1 DUF4287 domain-containing protein [Planctomycetota bacterium]
MAQTKVAKNSPFSLHPGFAMEESSMANLTERTGKTLEQWIRIVKSSGPRTVSERREWLKSVHGITTNYAMWIAERAEGRGAAADYDPDALVDAMYAGKKEALRPIHEKLLKLGLKLGKDVKACPCSTIVPLYRKHVFAQIKPTTNTRIDMGFALKDTTATGRLVDTGGFAKKDRITHRVPITSVAEIDAEVEHWLKIAYDMDV